MSDPSAWRRDRTPEQIEARLDAISRTRALSMDESLQLEWAITAQRDQARLVRIRLEELQQADRIAYELNPSIELRKNVR